MLVVIFLKTMIKNSFSSKDMAKADIARVFQGIMGCLSEPNVPLLIKSHLGECLKIGLCKATSKIFF
jgi:hypothetical protein